MADKTVSGEIHPKRGTASRWATINPVLPAGVFGYDTTNDEIRFGNGSAKWSARSPIPNGATATYLNGNKKKKVSFSLTGTVLSITVE